MAQSVKKIWIYGRHAVSTALENPKRRKHQLLYSGKTPPESAAGVICRAVGKGDLQKLLGRFAVHQGVALETDRLEVLRAADALSELPERCRILLLDDVEDVQNIGAILRSASLLGVDAVAAREWQESAHLARAAAGALEVMPLMACGNLAQFLVWLKKREFWVFGLDIAGEDIHRLAEMPPRFVLAVGREGRGLHPLVKKHCDILCRLPMTPHHQDGKIFGADSFNVSVSAALALYALQSRTSS